MVDQRILGFLVAFVSFTMFAMTYGALTTPDHPRKEGRSLAFILMILTGTATAILGVM